MARKIKLNMYDIYDLGLVWFGSERVKYTINNNFSEMQRTPVA